MHSNTFTIIHPLKCGRCDYADCWLCQPKVREGGEKHTSEVLNIQRKDAAISLKG